MDGLGLGPWRKVTKFAESVILNGVCSIVLTKFHAYGS